MQDAQDAQAELIARFRDRYRPDRQDVHRRIERAVIGHDMGASGYTTVAQADELGRRLHLSPASRVLDVGAGRGWPGLYLAATRGSTVVASDVPLEGVRAGRARAAADDLGGRFSAVAADARQLPFADASFDAVVHTDVAC